MNKVLTIVDTAGIQDYVFRTNKLRQIIGASYLVNAATKDWVEEVLKKDGLSKRIYSGGGNAMLLFDSMEEATLFSTQLSKKCIEQAPGLRLVVAHKEFDYDTVALGGQNGIINQVFELLSKLKAEGNAWQLETSLGVTQDCPYTSQPVVIESLKILGEIELPISAEALAKNNAKAKASFNHFKCTVDNAERTFPLAEDIDDITGKDSSKNLIAIVHIDGNDIGKRITDLVAEHGEASNNLALQTKLKDLSARINEASEQALKNILTYLCHAIYGDVLFLKGGKKIELFTKKENDEKKPILPIRPIVLGGDDLTLICDGRIALDLTVKYLQAAQAQTLSDNSPYYCKAGVCIVKRHFPFYPAYQLSLQLSSSAKALRKEVLNEIEEWKNNNDYQTWSFDDHKFSSLDWQICLNGIKGNLHEIRAEEYSGQFGQLNMRPLTLADLGPTKPGEAQPIYTSWRTWKHFLELLAEMNDPDILPRNKAKLFREVLREKDDVITSFLKFNRIKLDDLTYPTGWHNDRSAYFDALELQDIYEEL